MFGWPLSCFFFNDTATTEIYTLSLHDALPIPFPRIVTPNRYAQSLRSSRSAQAYGVAADRVYLSLARGSSAEKNPKDPACVGRAPTREPGAKATPRHHRRFSPTLPECQSRISSTGSPGYPMVEMRIRLAGTTIGKDQQSTRVGTDKQPHPAHRPNNRWKAEEPVASGRQRFSIISDGLPAQLPDIDPEETREWLDSFNAVVKTNGRTRARYLML